MVYREVKQGRLYQGIVSQIQELVISGQLQPGDKLPTEQQLAEQFGVSRTVVREAIKALAEKELVQVKHGKGVYVDTPSAEALQESMLLFFSASDQSLLALLEAREILEVEIARLAAERATDADKELLRESLRREAKILHQPRAYVEQDLRFHELLAQATHNEVLSILLNALGELLRESRRVTIEAPGVAQLSWQGHRRIFEAVRDSDEAGAREAMRQHLTMVRDSLPSLGHAMESQSREADREVP
jgi:GntR family transcriptional repressor for pyruvate dehydrogenase complex